MEIVQDFDEKSYNSNNGKPWKSSRILRVNPNFFMFLSLFIFFFFLKKNYFFHFFFIFSFFLFFDFVVFFSVFFSFLPSPMENWAPLPKGFPQYNKLGSVRHVCELQGMA